MIKMEVDLCKDCRHWRGNPEHDDGYKVCALTGSIFPGMRNELKEALMDWDRRKHPHAHDLSEEAEDLCLYAERLPINDSEQTLAYCEEPDSYVATIPYFGCVMWEGVDSMANNGVVL